MPLFLNIFAAKNAFDFGHQYIFVMKIDLVNKLKIKQYRRVKKIVMIYTIQVCETEIKKDC